MKKIQTAEADSVGTSATKKSNNIGSQLRENIHVLFTR